MNNERKKKRKENKRRIEGRTKERNIERLNHR